MASREQLSADLQESREEVEELRNQIDQLQEDSAQEMEDLEQQLKDQYAGEMTSKDDQIAALEAQLAEQNASWEASYNEISEQKIAMETDYESKLATWTKSREAGREVWTNPVTGETASTDMTWKNDRERKMEADMKNMKDKVDRNNAESRKGSSKVQEVQKGLNDLRKQLKVEQNAHAAIRQRHVEDVQASWDEIDKLEQIVMVLNEELERAKASKEEGLIWQKANEMSAKAKILRAQLEAQDATREMKKAVKSARLVQVALERELRRRIMQTDQLGLSLAEKDTIMAEAEAIKQREFDVLRVKLSKAHEVHQDDLEALARLWPDANGYVLPTMLQPYADVLRIERERNELLTNIQQKNKKVRKHDRGPDAIDTDSDDEEGMKHREDLERELDALREEMLYPSLRQIDMSELANPKFKVVSTTPRRRKFALYDTPRAFIDKVPSVLTGEGGSGDSKEGNGGGEPMPLVFADEHDSNDDGENKQVIGESGEMVNPPENMKNDQLGDSQVDVSDAVDAALRLRLQIPREVMKYQPATAVASVATMVKDGRRSGGMDVFGGDPWDSDDDSYIPSNHVTPRDPNDVHEAKDEKVEENENESTAVRREEGKGGEGKEGKEQVAENQSAEKKNEKETKTGKPGEEEEKKDDRPKNPITGQPMNIHSSGPSLGPVVEPLPPPPAPSDKKMSGTVPMQPPGGAIPTTGTDLALSSTFLSQVGIDPNDVDEYYSTPRSMTRLYAKAGIAQIKRLMKAGLRPLGELHDLGGGKNKGGAEDGDADDEGDGGEAVDGEEGDNDEGEEGGEDDEDDEDNDDDDEKGSEDGESGEEEDSEDGSNAVSSDESDSDESEVSSVDIDAELGLATDGTAAKLAKEAAEKRKKKQTWTSEEREIFEFAMTDLAEYDEDRKWIKIQKRVKTRTLKECKKFLKVLQSEEKSRNRELKKLLKSMCQEVEEQQSVQTQIFDVLITTVQQVEVVDYCRTIFVDCIYAAIDQAPSVIRIENERGRVRREEEMLRKEPWLSLKTQTKQSIPKVLGRAIRSMLRNGSLTKPRAHKLIEMYRRAPTLEEEDDIEPVMVKNSDGTVVEATSLTERSVESMVGEAITLAETDEPFNDLELEETVQGQKDTHGRLTSKFALRRHEAMLQREMLSRDREYTSLSKRQSYYHREIRKENERKETIEAHLESRKYVRDEKQAVADAWMRKVQQEQLNMDANASLRRTWCVAKVIEWIPPLKEIIQKERLILGDDGQPETEEDGVTPTGRKEMYEEEIIIDEARSLEIQCEKIQHKIAAVTCPVYVVDETTGERKQATNENGELKTERVHSEPLKIFFQKYKQHAYDPHYTVIPKWSYYIEMKDEEAMQQIQSLFPTEAQVKSVETRELEEEMITLVTAQRLIVRYDQRQHKRRIKLEVLRDVVRCENARVCVIEESSMRQLDVIQVREAHVTDISDELIMFHRRCGAVNRMESVHSKLLSWIQHRASRSMQTKDELLLLAKNAQHKVRKAQSDLNEAQNPLTEAFCEQRLNERLREADKVLRYVRKRFHAELDVRRQLAKERRSELIQQCARLEIISKMSLERLRTLRSVRRSQEQEMHYVRQESIAMLEWKEMYEGDGRNVEETVQHVLNDVLCQVEEKEKRIMQVQTKAEIEYDTNQVNHRLKVLRTLQSTAATSRQQLEAEKEATRARQATREREHAVILDEIEKLEGAAGEWLANNQVQQAEDQLALARSALDDSQKMMEVMKQELRADYNDLYEKMEVQQIKSRANEKMLKNEISSRRRAAGLAIAHMQKVAEQARDALEHLRKEKDAEIMRMAEAHAKQMAELNARLEELELLAERRGKWVNSLQVQIRLMRKEKIALEEKFQEANSAWERERDGLTKQLRFQETQSERRMAWIESLKVEVETQEKEKVREKEQYEQYKEIHLTREKELRWNVWQRDETARRIRMDADSVFKWFLESIANLAGASKRHNDRMFYNGAVGMLNAIISKDCARPDLKPLAARALGALAWNGFVDHRVISRRSRDAWSAWIGVVASEEKWRFDLGDDERKAMIAEEAKALRAAQVEKANTAALANRTVRLLKESYSNNSTLLKNIDKNKTSVVTLGGVLGPTYGTVSGGPLTDYTHGAPSDNRVRVLTVQEAMKSIGPNARNQEAIGASYNALTSLVALCHRNQSEAMKRYASDALAVLSISMDNRGRMEQIQNVFSAMVDLCSMEESPEVQRNAAAALGNMSFNHMANQTLIGDGGGIEALCTLCGLSLDVDVLENATAALVNLSRSHEQNALRVGTAYGIEALVRLTNSTATADLSTPDGERVQGNAAEALVNATRNDSHENAERVRSCGVRPIVLMCTSKNLIVQRAAPLGKTYTIMIMMMTMMGKNHFFNCNYYQDSSLIKTCKY